MKVLHLQHVYFRRRDPKLNVSRKNISRAQLTGLHSNKKSDFKKQSMKLIYYYYKNNNKIIFLSTYITFTVHWNIYHGSLETRMLNIAKDHKRNTVLLLLEPTYIVTCEHLFL